MMTENFNREDLANSGNGKKVTTDSARKRAEKDIAKFAAAVWQQHHGPLNKERLAEFLSRHELKRLVIVSDSSIVRAIARSSLISEFVQEALFFELERLRYQADSFRGSPAAANETEPKPVAKSRTIKQKATKRSVSKSSQRAKPKKKATPPSHAGVAHRASGWSASARSMPSQANDTERCNQCGARISASAASLHDCS